MEQSHPGLIDSDQTAEAMTANGEMSDMRKEFMPLEKVDEGKSTHTPEYDQVITSSSILQKHTYLQRVGACELVILHVCNHKSGLPLFICAPRQREATHTQTQVASF